MKRNKQNKINVTARMDPEIIGLVFSTIHYFEACVTIPTNY